jgi:transposase
LRAPLFSLIPDQTVEVAHAAFPKGNPYMRMRDELSPIYTNPEFAALFPTTGQPAYVPIRIKLRIATHCKAVHTLLMYSTQCENL